MPTSAAAPGSLVAASVSLAALPLTALPVAVPRYRGYDPRQGQRGGALRFLIPTAAMITLAACSTSSGDDTDTDTSSSGLTVGSVAKEECAGDSGDATCGGTEGLTATDSGGGVVHVVDAGVHLTCCVDVLGAAATSDGTLTVTYTETGDACDCTCYHVLEYDISGVAAGTWTIVAGDHSGDVTVGG